MILTTLDWALVAVTVACLWTAMHALILYAMRAESGIERTTDADADSAEIR